MSLSQVYDVPAGTGMILIGEKGESHTYEIPFVPTEGTIEGNLLVGTRTAQELPKTTVKDGVTYTNYILGKKNDVVGFFQPKDDAVIEAGMAYLRFEGNVSATVLHISGIGDDTTGIEQLRVPKRDTIYNLSGQRVENPKKGIYIVGGKKVIY